MSERTPYKTPRRILERYHQPPDVVGHYDDREEPSWFTIRPERFNDEFQFRERWISARVEDTVTITEVR